MVIQTDDSFLSDQTTGSSSKRKRHQLHLEALRRERPEEKKNDIQHDDTAPKKGPATRLYHAQEITGNEDIQFFENSPSVLPTTTMMNDQVFTVKVIQLQVSIDTCPGM